MFDILMHENVLHKFHEENSIPKTEEILRKTEENPIPKKILQNGSLINHNIYLYT